MPSGWDVSPLGDLLSQKIKNGYSPVCPSEPTGKWILSLGAVGPGGFNRDEVKPAPISDGKLQEFKLQSGDFLISRSNTRDRVGFSAIFRGEIDNCHYPDLLMRFRVDESKILPEYLENYLYSRSALSYLQGAASGTSGTMVKITKGIVERLPVPLPSLKEQEKIAKVLSAWGVAIAKLESLLVKKEAVKAHFLNKIFSGDICLGGNERENYLLDSLFEQRSERGGEGDLLSVTRDRGIIPQTESDKKDTSNSDKSKYLRIYPNDIVYNTMRMWQGVSSVSRLQGLVSPAYTVCYLKNKDFSVDYFGYFFKNKKMIHEFHRRSQGLVDDTLNLKFENFKKIKIFVHPPKQQVAIAQFFGALDFEILILRKKLVHLRLQKQGLMQQLLTGKKRVKV